MMLPLAYSLKHEDGSRNGNVERIANAQHGNPDVFVGSLTPLVGQSCSLGTHDDTRGTHHIRFVIEGGVLQLGGKDADAIGFQPLDALF